MDLFSPITHNSKDVERHSDMFCNVRKEKVSTMGGFPHVAKDTPKGPFPKLRLRNNVTRDHSTV